MAETGFIGSLFWTSHFAHLMGANHLGIQNPFLLHFIATLSVSQKVFKLSFVFPKPRENADKLFARIKGPVYYALVPCPDCSFSLSLSLTQPAKDSHEERGVSPSKSGQRSILYKM